MSTLLNTLILGKSFILSGLQFWLRAPSCGKAGMGPTCPGIMRVLWFYESVMKAEGEEALGSYCWSGIGKEEPWKVAFANYPSGSQITGKGGAELLDDQESRGTSINDLSIIS